MIKKKKTCFIDLVINYCKKLYQVNAKRVILKFVYAFLIFRTKFQLNIIITPEKTEQNFSVTDIR